MAADALGRVPNKEQKPEIAVQVVHRRAKGIIIHYVPGTAA